MTQSVLATKAFLFGLLIKLTKKKKIEIVLKLFSYDYKYKTDVELN